VLPKGCFLLGTDDCDALLRITVLYSTVQCGDTTVQYNAVQYVHALQRSRLPCAPLAFATGGKAAMRWAVYLGTKSAGEAL